MYKLFLTAVLYLAVHQYGFSQRDIEDFQLSSQNTKVKGAFYNRIRVLDLRPDTTNMGIVQKGAFNRKVNVVPVNPIIRQIEDVFNKSIENDAKNEELIFLLRHFSFAEVTGALSEKGYCYFSADIFAENNDGYQRLSSIDTVILVSGMDVTKAMLREGSKIGSDYLINNLRRRSVSSEYLSLNEVLNISDYEKKHIPLYTTIICNEGIYKTYQSFKNQTPDQAILSTKIENDELEEVSFLNEKGKKQKVRAKDVYAIVSKGNLFIATESGFYKLLKINNDFYFTGFLKTSADAGDVLTASLFFGVIGGLIASSNSDACFYTKIDYRNGGFIRIMEVQNPKPRSKYEY